jgi:hypothetical protein
VHATIQEYGIHEDDIWNFDETGFAMGLSRLRLLGKLKCKKT